MKERALQDQGTVSHCYGCGPDNDRGLRIKSFWEGEEAVSSWKPAPYHCGGSPEIVNGGIIASLIDCHSLNLAIAHAYKSEGRAIGSTPKIAYVTGRLEVSYLRPAPITGPLQLRAKIVKVEGRKTWLSCTLSVGKEICATGEVLGVRVRR